MSIGLTDTIASLGAFPIIDANQADGGWHTVPLATDLTALALTYGTPGMIAVVLLDHSKWELANDGSTWALMTVPAEHTQNTDTGTTSATFVVNSGGPTLSLSSGAIQWAAGATIPSLGHTQAAAGAGAAMIIQAQQGAANQAGGALELKSGAFGAGGTENGALQWYLGASAAGQLDHLNNVSMGVSSLAGISSGAGNIGLGVNAGLTLSTGTGNTIVGGQANVGFNNVTYATALGAYAVVSTPNSMTLGGPAGGSYETRVGIGISSPLAYLHLPGGQAAAGYAAIKFSSGTLLAIVENGTMEYDGSDIYVTTGGVRKSISSGGSHTQNTDTGTTSATFVVNTTGTTLTLGAGLITWAAAATVPGLTQTAAAAGAGVDLTISAQQGAATLAGGNLVLKSGAFGAGGTVPGALQWYLGAAAAGSMDGRNNVSMGVGAFAANIAGTNAVSIGSLSLASLTGSSAVGVGYAAANAQIANATTAVGYAALYKATGTQMTAVGYLAGRNITTGPNTVIGDLALYGLDNAVVAHTNNVAIGAGTQRYNSSGSFNVSVGDLALGGAIAKTGAITAVADAGGGNVTITAANTLVAGESVNITGTTNYNGTYAVVGTPIAASFVITKTWVNTQTGTYQTVLTGSQAIAIGYQALQNATTAASSVVVGYQAGAASTSAGGCTSVGYQAQQIGNYANITALGYQAAKAGGGAYSTMIGFQAGLACYGTKNVAVGSVAGATVTSGTYNTFLGTNSDVGTATLNYATAIGTYAVVNQSNSMMLGGPAAGTYETRVGIGIAAPSAYLHLPAGLATAGYAPLKLTAGVLLTVAEDGVFEMNASSNLYFTTSTSRKLLIAAGATVDGIGVSALKYSTGVGNVAVGYQSQMGVNGVTNGTYNTSFGSGSLPAITTGAGNVSVGANSSITLTSGSNNVAVGSNALRLNVSGNSSVAIGESALYSSTQGLNVAVGRKAMVYCTTGFANVATGNEAFGGVVARTDAITAFADGGSGTVIVTAANTLIAGESVKITSTTNYDGYYVVAAPSGTQFTITAAWVSTQTGTYATVTTGSYSVAVGYQALQKVTSASNSVGIGYQALQLTTTGGANVAIGYQAGGSIVTGTNNTCLGVASDASGNIYYSTAIGSHSVVTQPNSMMLGGPAAGTYETRVGIGIAAPLGYLHLPGGKATAGYAAIKFNSGTLLGAVENGAMEYDGSDFYVTVGGVRKSISSGTSHTQNTDTGTTQPTFIVNSTGVTLTLGNGLITWAAGATVPGLTQTQAAAGAGVDLTISAQQGAATLAGGSLVLKSGAFGAGGTVRGSIKWYLGATAAGLMDTLNNVAMGAGALATNTVGTDSCAVGYNALHLSTTGTNCAFGSEALAALTSGDASCAIGYQTLKLATGGSNTALGALAGASVVAGAGNIFIGRGADVGAVGINYSVAIGYQAVVNQDNSMMLGGPAAGAFETRVGIGIAAPSAYLHLPAGKVTAGYAPLKFNSGPVLTVVENGTVEYDATDIYGSVGGTRTSLTGLSHTAKTAVRVAILSPLVPHTYAATGGGTLTETGNGRLAYPEGYVPLVGDRMLIAGETAAPEQNGIYTVSAVGSPGSQWVIVRATDANTSTKIAGASVTVAYGNPGAGMTYTFIADPITFLLNTDAVAFLETSVKLYSGGSGGLVFTTDVLNVKLSATSPGQLQMQADGIGFRPADSGTITSPGPADLNPVDTVTIAATSTIIWDFVLYSATGHRAGQLQASVDTAGGVATYETSTAYVGTPAVVTLSVVNTAGVVKLQAASDSANWTAKFRKTVI